MSPTSSKNFPKFFGKFPQIQRNFFGFPFTKKVRVIFCQEDLKISSQYPEICRRLKSETDRRKFVKNFESSDEILARKFYLW